MSSPRTPEALKSVKIVSIGDGGVAGRDALLPLVLRRQRRRLPLPQGQGHLSERFVMETDFPVKNQLLQTSL